MDPSKVAAIIPAAGSGLRMGLPEPKQFLELAGVPVLVHTLKVFQQIAAIGRIIVVVPPESCDPVHDMVRQYQLEKVGAVVAGGKERQDSVFAGLETLPEEVELVLVHDGVRPFVPATVVENCLLEAEKSGAAMTAVPVKDTLKAVSSENVITDTVDRVGVWQAQTPQAAARSLLQKAFAAAAKKDFIATDEAGLMQLIGHPVKVVAGSELNIKITRPEDLVLAKAILKESGAKDAAEMTDSTRKRIGYGYDAHRLVEGRQLVLGGIEVIFEKGLQGHSDADVLTHALCDAILGAVGAGDLGVHFPDSDDKFKDISSLRLLEEAASIAAEKGYVLQNADITVVAQKPRLSPYIAAMKQNLAAACCVEPDMVNIKATTTEGMGFEGRGEGISAHAVVMFRKK